MKKPTLKGLKKKCWALFSEYIRRKDADEGGTTYCFTCDKPIDWKYQAQAGHAIGGRRNMVLYDEDIVRPQCYPCNAKYIGNGRPDVFIPKLIKEHSLEWWESKATAARLPKKYTRSDLEDLIQTYKQKLDAI